LSSWDWLLVQSSSPVEVSPTLVRRFHFAVGRFPGFVAFPQRVSPGHCSVSRSNPLFEFDLPLEYYPVKPCRPTAVDRPLSWAFVPFSTSGTKGLLGTGLPARYVPPSGFGYPLDGLLPLVPRRFFFTPAALMGFTLRSFLLPKGIRVFRPGRTHLPFNPAVFPPPKRRAGPTGLGFWVSPLSEVPDNRASF
jgi:hypothetical protein